MQILKFILGNRTFGGGENLARFLLHHGRGRYIYEQKASQKQPNPS